jgi:hypothetical protein
VAALRHGTETGEFDVKDPVLLANTLYSTGLGGLQLARLGLQVRLASPGVPGVSSLSTDEVRRYLVVTALKLASS